MIDDGIREGDLIIVETCKTARPGQTVVALVDGSEATVKRYYPGKNRIRLQPANENMKPMSYKPESIQLQGIVIGLMRRY